MKIIELTESQFSQYSKLHSARNFYQTVQYANFMKNYNKHYLGFINEKDETLMASTLLLEKKIGKLKIGYVPGSLLVDYNNETLFKDFINHLKAYLKEQKFIYITVNNLITYKIFGHNNEVLYFDTNITKMLDELSFKKVSKVPDLNVVLETEKTPDETFKLFNNNTKRNINYALQRAITIFKDEGNNTDLLLNLTNNFDPRRVRAIVKAFDDPTNAAEIYFAKINPEKYINNYRFLLKEEEENNEKLNSIMQDINITKTNEFINKKMASDKTITKYNNEIIRATNLYTKYPDGIIVGAILIIKNNREIYFLDEGRNKELDYFYSSHLLKWEIIKKYLNLGYKIFNFGPVKSMDKKNDKYNFKMGFGGKVYECVGDYDLVLNKGLYKPVKLFYSIFRKFKMYEFNHDIKKNQE